MAKTNIVPIVIGNTTFTPCKNRSGKLWFKKQFAMSHKAMTARSVSMVNYDSDGFVCEGNAIDYVSFETPSELISHPLALRNGNARFVNGEVVSRPIKKELATAEIERHKESFVTFRYVLNRLVATGKTEAQAVQEIGKSIMSRFFFIDVNNIVGEEPINPALALPDLEEDYPEAEEKPLAMPQDIIIEGQENIHYDSGLVDLPINFTMSKELVSELIDGLLDGQTISGKPTIVVNYELPLGQTKCSCCGNEAKKLFEAKGKKDLCLGCRLDVEFKDR